MSTVLPSITSAPSNPGRQRDRAVTDWRSICSPGIFIEGALPVKLPTLPCASHPRTAAIEQLDGTVLEIVESTVFRVDPNGICLNSHGAPLLDRLVEAERPGIMKDQLVIHNRQLDKIIARVQFIRLFYVRYAITKS